MEKNLTICTTNKALRILDNIMEGCPEWFAKDEHHSASLEYSRVGGDYEIFTAKFYGAGATVRKLNFFDIDDALGYLTSNRYYNVASNPAEEPELATEPESAYAGLVGAKLHTYDSWNGSSCTITIEDSEPQTNGRRFTGTNSYGGKSEIYVPDNLLPKLIETGEAEMKQEIDHCTVRTTWTLIK